LAEAFTGLADGNSLRCEASLLEVPATESRRVRELLEDVEGPWSLDFTGGTKAMSCGARLAYESRGPRASLGVDLSSAYYVDDAAGVLRDDSGRTTQINENLYRLDLIAALHGARFLPPRPETDDRGSRWERTVDEAVRAWAHTRAPHRWESRLNPRVAISETGRDYEIDVLVRIGRRIGLISCYAGADYGVAKQKLFEAIERARQTGGDLARVALAAPLAAHQRSQFAQDLGVRWTPNRAALLTGAELSSPAAASSALDQWWGRMV
jgi:hypothetical protein